MLACERQQAARARATPATGPFPVVAHLDQLLAARLVEQLVEQHGGVRQLGEEALVQLHRKARQVRRLARLAAPCVRIGHLSCIA